MLCPLLRKKSVLQAVFLRELAVRSLLQKALVVDPIRVVLAGKDIFFFIPPQAWL
jgi:hypothetical protein